MARNPNSPLLFAINAPMRGSEESKRLNRQNDVEFDRCAEDFWHFLTYYHTFDEESKAIRLFPVDFEYLKDFNSAIEKHQKVVVLKARRLLVSHLCVARQLWQAMFAGTRRGPDGFHGAILSKDEEQAIYQTGRALFAFGRLPEWMQDRSPLVRQNETMLEFAGGGKIQAFSMKKDGPQGFGFSEMLFDELSYHEAARTAWMGALPALGRHGKLIAVSTPNGRVGIGKFFYQVWKNEDDEYKGLHRLSYHWTQNPEHNNQEWYDAITAGMDAQGKARNMELSFIAYAGKPVWPTFEQNVHVGKISVVKEAPILIGWDFGYHYPAISFWQFNTRGQFMGLREIQGMDEDFDVFCKRAKVFAASFYDRRRHPELHFVDPAGFQRYRTKARSGAMSDVQEIRMQWAKRDGELVSIRRGALQVGTRSMEGPRLKEVRKLWPLRSDGRPGIMLDDSMEISIEGCLAGYSYPEKGDSEEPLKNEFSHLQDTLQMVVTGYNSMNKAEPNKNDAPQKRRVGHRLGF